MLLREPHQHDAQDGGGKFQDLRRKRLESGLEDAYRPRDLGGYSVAMPADASETLLSATTLLWAVVSVMAALVLFGSINRRRSRLTESLRDYVDQEQDGRQAAPTSPDESSSD